MNKNEDERISKLIEYYKDKKLLIIGLNDSQGVNTTSTFFKKGLLEYLAAALTCEKLTPEVINAFSLTLNKTEHIDYFLKNNLSLEEIKLSQIYSVISAFEKVMTDIHLPKILGQAGNAYRMIYTPKKGDENIHITDCIKNTTEVVMVYSSGVNDLMRAVGANPFSIKGDYKNKDKKPNYNYTLEKVNNPYTLKKVIENMEKNYNTILGINPNTDIYTLGAYVPKSLQSEEMNIFRDLVIAYNEQLAKLCKQYGVTFVETEMVGKKYNNSESNFHISTAGHNALANYILGYMYHNKFENNNKTNIDIEPVKISSSGSLGVIKDIEKDIKNIYVSSEKLTGYAEQREFDIITEHIREQEIFKKVLKKAR